MKAAGHHNTMSSVATDAPESMMLAWENAIRQGNQAYTQHQDQLALQQYQVALNQAKSLLRDCVQAGEQVVLPLDTILAAYVVSHHNLANVYARQGDVNTAACRLCEVHQCLSRIGTDPGMECALREAAQRHGQRTYQELLNFCHLYSQHPLVERTLRICSQFCPRKEQTLH